MYVRLIQGLSRSDAHRDALNYFGLSIAAALRRQAGYVSAHLLRNPLTHQCLVLIEWETAADRQAADGYAPLQTLFWHFQQYCCTPLLAAEYELSAQVV